ncbi:MAG: glycosyltransferase [Alphaproteobacteria bacterium]|nr:glycosyltransferase [Alphaproteobacteria bacterium]
MHVIFLNPQGNFDPADSHLTEHSDFGGQLVYVKEVAQAMTAAGHRADIVTRQIDDPAWPEFAAPLDHYAESGDALRIVRLPCGGPLFLAKEQLWDHLPEFIDNVIAFYGDAMPDFATAHYADGGYCAALLECATGIGFTFTGHSLGAQKLDKLGMSQANAADMEARYRFSRRIAAERLAMGRAFRIITSTEQERREQYSHPLYAHAVNVDDPAKFSVIPPGVNTQIFTTDPGNIDRSLATDLLSEIISAARPMVVVSNRLDEKKNTIGVVEAFGTSKLLRQRADLLLCVRGIDDPFADVGRLDLGERRVLEPILAAIEQHGLRESVRFLNIPSQRALAATYRAVAMGGGVFALTAFYEPFGLAPIEAAACGLACVATVNGGPSEIFSDGSGILVDPTDPTNIAQGLLTALDGQADLSQRARERVRTTYTWDMTAERYATVIEEGVAYTRSPAAEIPPLDSTDLIRQHLLQS